MRSSTAKIIPDPDPRGCGDRRTGSRLRDDPAFCGSTAMRREGRCTSSSTTRSALRRCPKTHARRRYCTDIAKAFGAPVFHVNAEDPEGCVRAANLAIEMRQKFQCDVFIDLNCYRKYGHNEGDEPTFTQPLEYALIKAKRSIREIFREQSDPRRTSSTKQTAERDGKCLQRQDLQQALEEISSTAAEKNSPREGQGLPKRPLTAVNTTVTHESLIPCARTILQRSPKIKDPSQDPSSAAGAARDGPRESPDGRYRLGHGRAFRLCHSSQRRRFTSVSQGRMCGAARFPTVTRSGSTRSKSKSIFPSPT